MTNEMSVKERTLGDGMDGNELELSENSIKTEFSLKLPQKPSPSILKSMRPVVPTSRIYTTVPKYIPKERRYPKYLVKKPKEPRFIPYEPFKGAVQPITPRKKRPLTIPTKISKNNVEIHQLVSQMTDMRTAELAENCFEEEDNTMISKKDWEREKKNFENDIKNLRESNIVLENQLKLQTQVNGELKTLLVAAVGEDLETRVQHLTEDKLHLARALLKSANHLTTHQEQTEWLSGQCEVWRSKFLASSLMVEELAKWKSALTTRVRELQILLSKLLEDQRKNHRTLVKTTYNLSEISTYFKMNSDVLKSLDSADIDSLTNVDYELSQNIFDKFITYNEEDFGKFYNRVMDLPHQTQHEANGRKILQNGVSISSNHDELCKAVLGEAGTAASDQLIPYSLHTQCCSHCKGEVKNV